MSLLEVMAIKLSNMCLFTVSPITEAHFKISWSRGVNESKSFNIITDINIFCYSWYFLLFIDTMPINNKWIIFFLPSIVISEFSSSYTKSFEMLQTAILVSSGSILKCLCIFSGLVIKGLLSWSETLLFYIRINLWLTKNVPYNLPCTSAIYHREHR